MFLFVKTFHFLIHAISDFQSVTIFLASTVLSTIKTKFGQCDYLSHIVVAVVAVAGN